jgi:GTPase SAR1 family protein
MHGGDFSSPPFLLLLGPYSAGKTTFIEYLVGKKFPGARVGPEPTTDKFYAIMHGEEDRIIPGNALAVTPGTPFNGLQKFGNNFLTRFEGSQVTDSDVLKRLTIIDTVSTQQLSFFSCRFLLEEKLKTEPTPPFMFSLGIHFKAWNNDREKADRGKKLQLCRSTSLVCRTI